MKKFLLLLPALFMQLNLGAQILVDSLSMPVPGTIMEYKTRNSLSGMNYTDADSNYVWDFSALTATGESADTFVSVSSLPTTYNVIYNNPFDQSHRATVASPQGMMSIPMLDISDPYTFYKNKATRFSIVGLGASFNGYEIPARFDSPDVLYNFPLTFGDCDTSEAAFEINIPGFGYYGENRYRINTVDGWGVLYLPSDTFEVIRVVSKVVYTDSIFLDTIGYGYQFSRTETEYKWLSDAYSIPVLQIIKSNQSTRVRYFDTVDYTGINQMSQAAAMNLYPNPAGDIIYIAHRFGSSADYSVYDVSGRNVMNGMLTPDCNYIQVAGLTPGIYFLRLYEGDIYYRQTFIKK